MLYMNITMNKNRWQEFQFLLCVKKKFSERARTCAIKMISNKIKTQLILLQIKKKLQFDTSYTHVNKACDIDRPEMVLVLPVIATHECIRRHPILLLKHFMYTNLRINCKAHSFSSIPFYKLRKSKCQSVWFLCCSE